MKRINILVAVVMVAGLGLVLSGCGGKKTTPVAPAAPTSAVIVEPVSGLRTMPCSPEGFSTAELIRAAGTGRSMSQQVARDWARQAALADLGLKIDSTVSVLVMDYYKSTNQDLTEDLKQRFEGGSDTVAKTEMARRRTICDLYEREGTNYVQYIAVEIDADQMAKALHNRLTEDQILRIDFEFEKFRERFSEELRKYEGNR